MTNPSPILLPMVALIAWSTVMWAWMYGTRIPAILKSKMKLDPQAPRGEQMATLPPNVRWKADNYNNLMEQPTLFYALVLALAAAGQGEGLNVTLAWVYFGLRVVHSLIQVTVNIIEWRFAVFFISGLVLALMTVKALAALI